MFHDWHGYVILIVYGLMTLAMILSAIESFRKAAKARHGIPAFAVGADCFIFYDKDEKNGGDCYSKTEQTVTVLMAQN
jgi:hypothetical protein